MSNKTISLKRTVLTQALALAFAAGMSSAAFAQSNTTGSIFGSVEAQAGTTIVVEGVGTGFRRTITPDANGKFQALSLPVGEYKVSLVKNGKVERTEDASVSIGGGSEVSFMPARVEVTGRANRIDVQNTNNGATFTARELAQIPVAHDVGAVIQLAAGTVSGDPRYGGSGNAPSFGGASASENAYYINGFPVTNPLTQVGFQSLPFGALAQAQILEGGYGAEFGRSTGGVVNLTTKRGTNTFETGAALQWAPNSLRARARNLYYPDGTVYTYRGSDTEDQTTLSAYVGGPIVKDKLFFFVAAEQVKTDQDFVRLSDTQAAADPNNGWVEDRFKMKRLFGKFDWNITDDHHLELTVVREKPEDNRQNFGFDYATLQHNGVRGAAAHYVNYGPNPLSASQGGDLDIIKYTGNFTDDLTVTALYGRTKKALVQDLAGYNPTMPLITFTGTGKLAGLNYINNQPVNANVLAEGANSKTHGTRLDLEYRLNNDHTLRAGMDNMHLFNHAGEHTSGGQNWRYSRISCTSTALQSQGGVTPAAMQANALQDANGNCYVVRHFVFSDASNAVVEQSAQYVEDRWQINKNLLLVAGLRNEQFENPDDQGKVIIKQSNQWEPRLGASWDTFGDGSLKVFGNAGRYHLQVPANVALRSINASTFLRQYFAYKGIDPATGAPTGLTAIGTEFSPDGETGAPKLPGYAAASDLKSHYQDELVLGFEKSVSKSLNTGFKITYRQLKNTIEDWCDARPFDNWAAAHGVNTDFFHGTGAFANKLPGDISQLCHVVNPGSTNTFDMDIDGDGKAEHIVLSPTDMGGGESARDGAALPKPRRDYLALDFFAEHPFDGKWYGKVNYTWSKSYGNTEGQLNSDLGQADPATTEAYDFKEIEEFATGRLPNDRTHVIKAFGFYNLNKEWTVGGNVMIASGRPQGCLGYYPDPNNGGAGYADAYRYCNLKAADLGNGAPESNTPVPRGSVGEFPWQARFDMNVAYKPEWAPGIMAKLDVFNVFNQQVATYREEQTDQTNPYGTIYGLTSPRSMKLTIQYDKKF
jgi:hypothetical protein